MNIRKVCYRSIAIGIGDRPFLFAHLRLPDALKQDKPGRIKRAQKEDKPQKRKAAHPESVADDAECGLQEANEEEENA